MTDYIYYYMPYIYSILGLCESVLIIMCMYVCAGVGGRYVGMCVGVGVGVYVIKLLFSYIGVY